MNCGKKILDMLILVIYLPPAMLFLMLSKKSRYANLVLYTILFIPRYAIVNCAEKNLDTLILVMLALYHLFGCFL